jgi:YgiT-type zinc finger domain-containing protein
MNERKYPCEFCDTEQELEERLVTVYRQRGEQHFIFERVPARVCRACGHRYYTLDVVAEMERLMNSPEAQAHTKPVPVLALSVH